MKIGELIAGPDPLVFSAEDAAGALVAIVPGVLWEQLQAEAPVWSDTEDQRDYALQMVELRLAGEPVRTVCGLRVQLDAAERR